MILFAYIYILTRCSKSKHFVTMCSVGLFASSFEQQPSFRARSPKAFNTSMATSILILKLWMTDMTLIWNSYRRN